MRRQLTAAGLLLAAATLITACATPGAGSSTAPDFVGVWGDSAASDTPWIDFADDGTLTGRDGCNSLRGEYSTQDGAVRISFGLSTLKGCPGVDTWLRHAATAQANGDTLIVFDHGGDEIGTLERNTAS